jgi:deoxyribose-phosphate aldolase
MSDIIGELLDLADLYERELPPAAALPMQPTGAQVAVWIDHTLLKPEATAEQVKILCQEARQHGFASVCVNPVYVPLAAGLLEKEVSVCAVVGFPLGATLPTQKALETLTCLSMGAKEIDMVMSIGALKGQAYGQVFNDVLAVTQVAHNQRAIVKVILETALLTRKEKIIACLLCKGAGADFLITSTGFSKAGAKVEDVDLMYRVVGPAVGVKAAGGIRDWKTAQQMMAAGATRLGASASIQVIQSAMALGKKGS